MKMLPRGLRNNNPGNIRVSKDKWQGLATIQSDSSFFQFNTPAWGIRALMVILRTYYNKYELKTVAEIIHRWAPPSENDTTAYTNAVASYMGVGGSDLINVMRKEVLIPLTQAIIRHENGQQPYDVQVFNRAYELL